MRAPLVEEAEAPQGDVWNELSDTVAEEERRRSGERRNSLKDKLKSIGIGVPPSPVHGRYTRASDVELSAMAEFGLMIDAPDGSPSAGGRQEWGAVNNLDVFFKSLYSFFHQRGLTCIVASHLSNLATLGFSVVFSTFLFAFVDWGELMKCQDEDSCHTFDHYVSSRSLSHPTTMDVVTFGYFVLFSLYWFWNLLSFFAVLREGIEMSHFYRTKLKISNRELQTLEWSEVVARVVEIQESGRYRLQITKNVLTEHDIVSRIMRKENYLIAFINKSLIPMSVRLPLLGPTSLFSKSMEWHVHFCVLSHMFNDKFTIRRQFLNDPDALRRRFKTVGVVNLLLLPFILMFLFIHFFLKHAQEWHHAKEYLGPRQWTPLAAWSFREFQELPHVFEARLNRSYEPADAYQRQFPAPVLTVVAKGLAFISGSVVAVLLLSTLLDESILLYIHIGGRNLFWYITIFSGVFALSRAAVPAPRDRVFAPEEAMMNLVKHTHYLPDKWRGKCHTYDVRDEFLQMFQFKAAMFLQEMLSALLSPYLLFFVLPGCVPDLLHFVQDLTVEVEGVGAVCGYSAFDFDRFGDRNYGAPKHCEQPHKRAVQGKMEKSFLNFTAQHPRWRAGERGAQLQEQVAEFSTSMSQSQLQQTMETIAEHGGSGLGSGSVMQLPELSALGSQSRLAATLTEQQHENNFYWLEKYFEQQAADPASGSVFAAPSSPPRSRSGSLDEQ